MEATRLVRSARKGANRRACLRPPQRKFRPLVADEKTGDFLYFVVQSCVLGAIQFTFCVSVDSQLLAVFLKLFQHLNELFEMIVLFYLCVLYFQVCCVFKGVCVF